MPRTEWGQIFASAVRRRGAWCLKYIVSAFTLPLTHSNGHGLEKPSVYKKKETSTYNFPPNHNTAWLPVWLRIPNTAIFSGKFPHGSWIDTQSQSIVGKTHDACLGPGSWWGIVSASSFVSPRNTFPGQLMVRTGYDAFVLNQVKHCCPWYPQLCTVLVAPSPPDLTVHSLEWLQLKELRASFKYCLDVGKNMEQLELRLDGWGVWLFLIVGLMT